MVHCQLATKSSGKVVTWQDGYLATLSHGIASTGKVLPGNLLHSKVTHVK